MLHGQQETAVAYLLKDDNTAAEVKEASIEFMTKQYVIVFLGELEQELVHNGFDKGLSPGDDDAITSLIEQLQFERQSEKFERDFLLVDQSNQNLLIESFYDDNTDVDMQLRNIETVVAQELNQSKLRL